MSRIAAAITRRTLELLIAIGCRGLEILFRADPPRARAAADLKRAFNPRSFHESLKSADGGRSHAGRN